MALVSSPDSPANWIYAILLSRHSVFTASELIRLTESDTSAEALTSGLQTLVHEGRAVLLSNEQYLSDVAATRLRETARRLVAAYHKQNPLRSAMPRENLEAPLQKAAAFHEFDAVLNWLVSQDILVFDGTNAIRLPQHRIQMPVGWQKAADEIRAVYEAAGLQPPLPGNFQANYPRDVSVPGILGVLVETGELIALDDRHYVSAKAVDETKEVLRQLAALPEGITVGGLRNATGASRRIILPLLEYFDAQGITRRIGESRVFAGE